MKKHNYYVIQGWMVDEIESMAEIFLYAIIHGFCQSENQSYTGSINYLVQCTKSSRRTVQRNLSKLEENGLLTRKEIEIFGKPFIEYRTIVPDHLETGVAQMTPPRTFDTPPRANLTPNNDINIITDTIKEKKVEFQKLMREANLKRTDKLPPDQMNAFYKYWTEGHDFKKGAKMRYEKEAQFSMSRRMTTWYNNWKKREQDKKGDRL